MKHKLTFGSMLLLALFSVLAPVVLASTTWYVNGVNGSDSNNCQSPTTACRTIGQAISRASSDDSISVAAATYAEHLSIGFNLTIRGSNAQTTIIDAGGFATVITIPNSATRVSLANLTIRNGAYTFGGGIHNAGILTVSYSAISGNFANTNGGGIYNTGTLAIFNTTISGNRVGVVRGAAGGGITNEGILTVVNSTIQGNTVRGSVSPAFGGGIENNGNLTISNTTFAGNITRTCLLVCGYGNGWDIYTSSQVTTQNSIFASSNQGRNCSGSIISHGYNLSSDNSCAFSNSGDRNNVNPMLGSLQYNGGPTQTMALIAGSPAIDAGNPSGCRDGSGHLLTTDQRGYSRHDPEDAGGCDMGAFEKQTD